MSRFVLPGDSNAPGSVRRHSLSERSPRGMLGLDAAVSGGFGSPDPFSAGRGALSPRDASPAGGVSNMPPLDMFTKHGDASTVCTGAPTVGATDAADVGMQGDFDDVMWMMMFDFDHNQNGAGATTALPGLPGLPTPAVANEGAPSPTADLDAAAAFTTPRLLSDITGRDVRPPAAKRARGSRTRAASNNKIVRAVPATASGAVEDVPGAGVVSPPMQGFGSTGLVTGGPPLVAGEEAQPQPKRKLAPPPQLGKHGRITEQTRRSADAADERDTLAVLDRCQESCEQLLIDVNCLMERKRQRDDRCRVAGCSGKHADRSPFLCKFHNHVGQIFIVWPDPQRVAEYGVGDKLPRIKLCNRCHRWEWLPNFTNRAGKYNLTCQMCCGKANYRQRKPGQKLTSVAVTLDGAKRTTIKIDSETSLLECRTSLLPEVGVGLRGSYHFVRAGDSIVDRAAEGKLKAKDICSKRKGRNRLTLQLVTDYSDGRADGAASSAGPLDATSYRPHAGSPVVADPHHGNIVVPGNADVAAALRGPGPCEGTLVGCGLLRGRRLQPGSACRVAGCNGSADADPFLCSYHQQNVVFVACMGSTRCFVRLCTRDGSFEWLAQFVSAQVPAACASHGGCLGADTKAGGSGLPAADGSCRMRSSSDESLESGARGVGVGKVVRAPQVAAGDGGAATAVGADADGDVPMREHNDGAVVGEKEDTPMASSSQPQQPQQQQQQQQRPSALYLVAQSLIRAFDNFVSSLGVQCPHLESPHPTDSSSASYHAFCVSLFERMKTTNQHPDVRAHLEAIQHCRNLWDECAGDNGVTLVHFATAVGCKEVLAGLQEYGLMQTLLHDRSTVDEEGRFDLSPKVCVRAASQGNLALVRQAVDVGVDVDCYSSDTCVYTPLMAAARSGHVRVVEFLVSRGADVGLQGQDGQTPLILAARNNHLQVVQLLIAHSADVNAGDMYAYTALMRAAREGHLNIVKCLAEAGADVNAKAKYNGYTALLWCAINGYAEIAQYLVENGADPNLTNAFNETPLTWARYNRHHGIEAMLIKHTVSLAAQAGSPPHGGLPAADDVHAAGLPLHRLACSLRDSLLRFAADAGVEAEAVEVPDASAGQAAYHAFCNRMLEAMVALHGQNAVRRFLESHHGGKAVWQVVRGDNDFTLKSMAGTVGCEKVSTKLAEHVVVQSIVNEDGGGRDGQGSSCSTRDMERALVMAASVDDAEAVRKLLDAGAAVDVRHGDYTPLMAAARLGNFRTVQLLLDHGANVNAATRDGQTPLVLAANCAHMEAMELLVSHGADVDVCDLYGPVIVRAARNGHSKVVENLVLHGANVNAVGKYNGFTALMWAAHNGNLALSKLLVQRGADVGATNMFGETALQWARMRQNSDVVRFLESHNAAVSARNSPAAGSDGDAADAVAEPATATAATAATAATGSRASASSPPPIVPVDIKPHVVPATIKPGTRATAPPLPRRRRTSARVAVKTEAAAKGRGPVLPTVVG